MKSEWLKQCILMAKWPPGPVDDGAVNERVFYTGCRKILTGMSFDIPGWGWQDDLKISDCGFTKSKLTMLRRLYYHEESHSKAVELWERRVGQGKYGSVGFTCYNHLLKSDPEKKSKRASVMGPCIQSVTLTLLNDRTVNVDCFYRTTELFKKFPADLVFIRDQLLPAFNIQKLNRVRFHFANITCHPMYIVTILPMLDDPLFHLESLKHSDRRFFDWAVKWMSRYVCPEHHRGIAKFAQALRVQKDALTRIKSGLPALQTYLRNNHPGHRNEYETEEDDD